MTNVADSRQIQCIGLCITLLALTALTGCHSHFVDINVKNASGSPVSLVEVDYPSASFGKDLLRSDSVYHYRFKIQGSGPAKILWTDAKQVSHTVPGPSLSEGQEGMLTVTITGATAVWQTELH
jgi:hypothetical protein